MQTLAKKPPVNTTPTKRRSRLLVETVIVIAIAIAMMTIVPGVLNAIGQSFRVGLLGRFMALAIAALGIDLIWGYTGILSLGHGLFFALGGYSLAMFLQLQPALGGTGLQMPDFFVLYGVTKLPWLWQPFESLPFTIVAIVLLPTIVAAVLGYLVFRNRIRGVYFSILTQAALIVFFNFFNGQQKLINGTNGLKTDTTYLFGQVMSGPVMQANFYYLTIVLLALAYGLCRWLTSGKFGQLLVAIRDDEPRVRFTGYDPTVFKVLVFAVSAGLAGIAGALYTVQSGIITPKAMDIAFSIEMVIWVAVGGRGTLVGAVLGTLVVNFARSLLSEQYPAFWLFFQGALFLAVVTVLPDGFVGWFKTSGLELFRQLTGKSQVSTYPSLANNPDVTYEQQAIDDRKSNG
jgi:urea transport system permease protein